MSLLADVALPFAVDKTFTYQIPPDLEGNAILGARAVVPFGRKYAVGLITGFPDQSQIHPLRPVKDIIDSFPLLSEDLLRVCRWVAEYYLAPLGEVLKTALPHSFAAGKREVSLAVTPDQLGSLVTDLLQRSPKRARVLQLLARAGPTVATDLQRAAGLKSIHAVLNDMEREGLVKTIERMPRVREKPKTADLLLLAAVRGEKIAAALQSLPPRRKRAARLLMLLHQLQQHGITELPVREALRRSATSSATVRELAVDGLVKVERREIKPSQEYGIDEQTLSIVLNARQREVLSAITGAVHTRSHRSILLHGVTGSGKTQVYIEAIRSCLNQGLSAIVLVPEISLTPQIVRRFKSHFSEQVAVVHSRMSPAERFDVWQHAARGKYRVVIGPRSAVFAPLRSLGLIVVDEEHDASYKQYDATPRYHARDVAIMRARESGAIVVLGSATPSAESYYNAQAGKYLLLEMPERIDSVPLPPVGIVDMNMERRREYSALKETLPAEQRSRLKGFRQSSISQALRDGIRDRLAKGEGIILLQNRRGFAPFVECQDCGYTETCENCSITLTYHLAKKHLRCHYCGIVRQPHSVCPHCNGRSLELLGVGTQRVEQDLSALFPGAKVARMDLDTTSRRGAHDRILRRFGEGQAEILLGTQMVAKGLDFPRVTLVGVISADTQMLLPDFRASERTFQLLTQVAGRAGRSTLRGEVVIQTHQPDHHTLRHVVDHNYLSFFKEEMEARRELHYPPLSRLVLVEAKSEHEEQARLAAEEVAHALRSSERGLEVLGPSPAVIAKARRRYRWHVIVKSLKTEDPSSARLHQALREMLQRVSHALPASVQMIIDVDPVALL